MAIRSNLKPWLDRGAGLARGTARQLGRLGRMTGAQAMGLARRAQSRSPAPKAGMDDHTLAAKVESVVFRGAGAPKGSVDVNAVDGVVYLHGEVEQPGDMKKIEAQVRAIPEVKDVKNLLHLPKTKAPSAAGTSTRRGRQATRSTPRTTGRFSRERKTAEAEPAPTELAAKREGRKAAPLGAKDTGEGSAVTSGDVATGAATRKIGTPTQTSGAPDGGASTGAGEGGGNPTTTTTERSS